MNRRRSSHEQSSSDPPALRRALEAERAARRDREQAEREARERLDAARAQVRELERRTEERISRIARGARAETERQLARLVEEKGKALEQLEHAPKDTTAVDRAARRVARQLTGGDGRAAGDRSGDADD